MWRNWIVLLGSGANTLCKNVFVFFTFWWGLSVQTNDGIRQKNRDPEGSGSATLANGVLLKKAQMCIYSELCWLWKWSSVNINWKWSSVDINWKRSSVNINWKWSSIDINWKWSSVDINWKWSSVDINWKWSSVNINWKSVHIICVLFIKRNRDKQSHCVFVCYDNISIDKSIKRKLSCLQLLVFVATLNVWK